MQTINIAAFEEQAEVFDLSIAATPKISTYCSGSDWILSAHEHLHPTRGSQVYEEDGHWLTLTQGPLYHLNHVLQPMESTWCFSCPLIGPDPRQSVSLLRRILSYGENKRRLLLLGGLPRGSKLHALCHQHLSRTHRVQAFPGSDCNEASLEGGIDGYLARRSIRFRASLRSGIRKFEKAGFIFERITRDSMENSILNRLLSIEMRSWKQGAGESVFRHHDHYRFYRDLIRRAEQRGSMRAIFVKRGSEDSAYVIGGVLGATYRGFQMVMTLL